MSGVRNNFNKSKQNLQRSLHKTKTQRPYTKDLQLWLKSGVWNNYNLSQKYEIFSLGKNKPSSTATKTSKKHYHTNKLNLITFQLIKVKPSNIVTEPLQSLKDTDTNTSKPAIYIIGSVFTHVLTLDHFISSITWLKTNLVSREPFIIIKS